MRSLKAMWSRDTSNIPAPFDEPYKTSRGLSFRFAVSNQFFNFEL
jgi:hypothetical protein